MLLVKTTLKTSLIPGAGLGCFAAEFITKGTVIWEFSQFIDRIFTEDEVKSMSDVTKQFINIYSYMRNGLYYLCVDNGRFINHHDEPNTIEDTTREATIASKDINIGDEIVSNYAHFGITPADARHNVIVVPEQVYIDRRTNDYIH
jgi:hypothetical protein